MSNSEFTDYGNKAAEYEKFIEFNKFCRTTGLKFTLSELLKQITVRFGDVQGLPPQDLKDDASAGAGTNYMYGRWYFWPNNEKKDYAFYLYNFSVKKHFGLAGPKDYYNPSRISIEVVILKNWPIEIFMKGIVLAFLGGKWPIEENKYDEIRDIAEEMKEAYDNWVEKVLSIISDTEKKRVEKDGQYHEIHPLNLRYYMKIKDKEGRYYLSMKSAV